MKVGDFIQSSAFVGQHGIIVEHKHTETIEGSWYHVVWLKVNHNYSLSFSKEWGRHEWLRSHEIEPRDIS